MTQSRHSFWFVAITTALMSGIIIIGGIGLEYIAEKVIFLIPLIIAIPSLNDSVGDYASIIAAHQGDPTEQKKSLFRELAPIIFKVVWINIGAIIVLSLLSAQTRGYELTIDFAVSFALFVASAMIVTVAFMFVIARLIKLFLDRSKVEADELLIPVITTVSDVVMLLLVTLAVLLIF